MNQNSLQEANVSIGMNINICKDAVAAAFVSWNSSFRLLLYCFAIGLQFSRFRVSRRFVDIHYCLAKFLVFFVFILLLFSFSSYVSKYMCIM